MRLDELRTQALRYLALGEYARALTVYERLLAQLPNDLDTRMRVGDVLAQIGQRELAERVYAAVAFYDLSGGRPLHALVAVQALSELGHQVAPLRRRIGQLYGAGSARLSGPGHVGARIAVPLGDEDVVPPDLSRPVGLEEVALAAASVAADTHALSEFPTHFPPVPLLSDLSEDAFARVLDVAVVRRLAHGALLFREGDAGDALYLLAAGEVRVFRGASGSPQELARLHEGALFGELALINAQPRTATVEVVGSADVIALGRKALAAAAGELEAVAHALEKFTRERLLKNLLATSALFKPFNPEQRIDLVRRFTGHELDADAEIVREGEAGTGLYLVLAGEVEVQKGDPPFATTLATLGPGECFGEISLLRDQPAMATVRAVRRSTILFLAREYFSRLTSALPEIAAYFEQLAADRLRSSALRMADPGEDPLF